MALAGLILGYIGVVLSVVAVVAIIIVAATAAPNAAQAAARSDAREFSSAILRAEPTSSGRLRDPNLLLRVYAQQATNGNSGCCAFDTLTLADGTPFLSATASDWERTGWRINVRRSILADRYACITVPETTSAATSSIEMVRDGRC